MLKASLITVFFLLALGQTLAFAPMNSPAVSVLSKSHASFKLFSEPGDMKETTPSEKEMAESLEEFRQQSQIKAIAVLAVAFSAFVYLKLQYDADPSHFIGSH
jgi:hypothetical protein